MGNPFTIQIFYPDGDPENMRVVDKRNWTGKVFYVSRDCWTDGINNYQQELETPGIYVLIGKEESFEDSSDDLQTIYIGQAENLFTRIGQQIDDSKRTFFQSIVCVTGSTNYNNAHFRWMEAHLIEQAKEVDRCNLENGNQPKKPKISNSEVVDIEDFLKDTLQMFPIVEINAFTSPKTVSPPIEKETNGVKKPRIGKEKVSELREKILDTFQERENVKLLKRSRATFYDKSKTIHVCCAVSKNYPDSKRNSYWFAPGNTWFEFLASGEKSYLLFAMEGQSKAVALRFDEFNKMKDNLGTTKRGNDFWWHVVIIEENGKFDLKLKGGNTLDISPYLFDIG